MNRAAYLYTNTPLNFDVAGKYDHEFPPTGPTPPPILSSMTR